MTSRNAIDPGQGAASKRLRQALSALATAPGDGSPSPSLFPAHSEELVAEFDEAYTGFIQGMDELPKESHLLALQAVDTKLSALIQMKDTSLWTALAFRDDPHWREVRVLAGTAMGEDE